MVVDLVHEVPLGTHAVITSIYQTLYVIRLHYSGPGFENPYLFEIREQMAMAALIANLG